ncbi:unnamed protein product [Microthlaspi erraticum]|uniref:Uncharacterized protein n=1 Tax=Microthlaspi erraticum TaxID=1685480 RepID=A0A6D2LED3_9BRAS|nr:unnamed protein product [Microthlaspi erraticum]
MNALSVESLEFLGSSIPEMAWERKSKDVPGRALVTWTDNKRKRANGAKRKSIDSLRDRSIPYKRVGPIELTQERRIDRAYTREANRSIPLYDVPLDRSPACIRRPTPAVRSIPLR